MTKVLVFDLGASSGRAILCSYKDEMLFNTLELHRFKNAPINVDGNLCWDIDDILKEVTKAMEKAHKYGYNAVSVDTWGVDFALIDNDGNFVQKPYCYRDRRTDGMPEKVFKEVISEEELYKRTGIKSANINTMYQLYAIKKKDPSVLARAKKLLMIPDLISYYLTGETKTEYTEATTTGLINPQTRNWDYELIAKLGLPKDIFCEIINPGDVYGYLKADFASGKIPLIAAASHDTAAALLAVPTQDKDFAFLSCGTWALFGTERDNVCIDEAGRAYGITNEGGYGNKTLFLKNIMGTWLIQQCQSYYQKKGEMFTFVDMEAFARSGMRFTAHINPNAPEFSEPGEMPEKISAYCKATGQQVPKTIATLLRVIYESLALEFARTLTSLEKLTGKTYPVIYIFGGGSKDKLLCEMTSNATGRQVFAGPAEATSIGNAMCGFISLGAIKDISTARRVISENKMIKEIYPSEKEHEQWLKWDEMLKEQGI